MPDSSAMSTPALRFDGLNVEPCPAPPGEFCHLYRLDQQEIGFARFIVEAYDNLAILSTVDASQGLVRAWGASSAENQLRDLMYSLGAELVDPCCTFVLSDQHDETLR
jgi:hypothetical protein